VQLTNGAYQSTTDVSSPDFMSINLAPQMAFGDLNGDGVGDAALLLAEKLRRQWCLRSLVAMLDQNGQPLQAASVLIDDRPRSTAWAFGMVRFCSMQSFTARTIRLVAQPGLQSRRCYASQIDENRFSRALHRMGLSASLPLLAHRNGDQFKSSAPLTVTGAVAIAPF